ncbi:MAG: LamG domain-containing protein [Gammaproteobacteria bacterium]|nr:LamG domain-containing protein [Gammaproteobacteria bacterium]
MLKTHFPTCIFLAIITQLLLASCGGGADTITNPDSSDTTIVSYKGPPPLTDDIRAFQIHLWDSLKEQNRCGQCHDQDQEPMFVNTDDINVAYGKVMGLVSQVDPATSLLATKVGEDHNCWLTSQEACATIITNMIINWRGDSTTTSTRTIPLDAPTIIDPGDTKTFPETPDSFAETVHPLLTEYCQNCHDDSASPPIAPFFANAEETTAYEAAKPKIDIDTPSISRLVVRLREEFHNCWSDNCEDDANAMLEAIEEFADAITPTVINADLLASKALSMYDGIAAAGGNRHESNLVALWEFKTGEGTTVFDTSGIEPAIDLSLSGDYIWLDGYGLELTGGNAKAQGDTDTSKKLRDFITSTGQYSIEAWIVPTNVSQPDAHIIAYSAGTEARNFTLAQDTYNYQLYNRTNQSNANGGDKDSFEPFSTEDAGEIVRTNLQHVVATFDTIAGRSIYVDGKLVGVTDPVTVSTSIADWHDGYSVVFGNEVSGNRPWKGKMRMVAIHNRVLTEQQVVQNFDVGVGEKFLLLFSITHLIDIDESYIAFEVSQFDTYSYLFDKPTFFNLDPNWEPVAIDIESMRIGINGKEAIAGQAYANLITSIDPDIYDATSGQLLSPMGAVIALEKSISSDVFFLTFEKFDGKTHVFSDPAGIPLILDGDYAEKVSDIGIRTFDEINASISAITGIPVTNTNVDNMFQQYRQQLPSVELIQAFLPSHQMAIAQLALASCSVLVDTNIAYFGSFDFTQTAANAFNTTQQRDQILNPLLEAAANVDTNTTANNLTTQPDETVLRDMLGIATGLELVPGGDSFKGLMTEMLSCVPGCDTITRTEQIVKAVCASAVSSAVMLIQ